MFSVAQLFGKDAAIVRENEFQLLLLSTIFPILAAGIVSPVLDSVIGPFGTTPANIGLMISFVTAPAIVFIPFAGVLADRYGRKPILTGSLLLFGATGTAIVATTDFRVVLGLRFLQGVGYSGIAPVITTSIGDMYEGERETTGQGLRMGVNGISGFVFPLVAGALITIAWQLPFLLYALAIPVAFVVHRWFEEPVDRTRSTREGDRRRYWRNLLEILAQRRALALVAGRALPVIIWMAFLTYNSLIVVRILGGTAFQAGVLAAVGNLVFAFVGSQTGRIAAAFDSPFRPLLLGNSLLGGGLVVVLFAPNVAGAVLGITIAGVGFGIMITLYRSITTRLSKPRLRGGIVSVAAAGSRLSATVTPIAMGAVIAYSEPTMGLAAAIRLAGLGAVAVGAGGGVLCLLVAYHSPEVSPGEF